jgi:DNA-binding transcriptional MerR regulator
MMATMNRLITTGDAARALGISSATLTRWAAAGTVTPAERTAGGHYRWDMASLRAQLRRRELGETDVTAEDIARVVHAAQRELQIIQGDPVPSPPWDEAPDYQAREAVAGVADVLRDPDLTAEQSHQRWADRMRADGWTYGEVKDAERKTHPTLVPFGDLPAGQQQKDRLFVAIVAALAPREDGGPA